MADLTTLVARHRDAPSPTLNIQWALLRLLDEVGSQQLHGDLRAAGQPWEILGATEHAWEMVPEMPGLYLFVWRPWFSFDVAEGRRPGELMQVLYVGKAGADDRGQRSTGDLRQRYRSYLKHLRGDPDELWVPDEPRTRLQLLDRYLKLRPLEFWYTVVADHRHVPLLEDRLMKMLNPPCNRQRTPRLTARLGPPQPAF